VSWLVNSFYSSLAVLLKPEKGDSPRTPHSIPDLVTIQDLLGHGQITTTQRYCRVSNLKVQRDYYKAIEVVMQRTQSREDDEFELDEKWIKENRV
jgi:hypothetical protein